MRALQEQCEKHAPPLCIGGLAVLLLTEALNRSSIFREYLCSLPEHVPLPVFYSKQRLAEMRAMLQLLIDKGEERHGLLRRLMD